MKVRLAFLSFALALLVACTNPDSDKAKKAEAARKSSDAAGDVSFQSFVGRLRKAVAARDTAELSGMMTANFGYRLDPPGEGEGAFAFWNESGLWSELNLVLNDRFAMSDAYMVAPAQFAVDPNYRGYRAGITRVGGSWKFAYFVTD